MADVREHTGGMLRWKRPLIVGASGQVGSALYGALARRGHDGVLMCSSRERRQGWLRLDLEELANLHAGPVFLDELTPDLILCTGGVTFVDGCEKDPETCRKANALGPAVLAAYARNKGAPFVFFSTDYVFDGSAEQPGPYGEDAPTAPLSVYGRTKLEGEQLVLEAHPGALIVRTTVVYGSDAAGKNFLYTLLRYPSLGQRVRVPADQISTPTYNRDLAEATLALAEAGVTGVVHVAGPELMDRMQFAREVAEVFGLDTGLIDPVSTASLGQAAARPLHSGLKTRRLEELMPSLRRHTVREALQDCEPALRSFIQSLSRKV